MRRACQASAWGTHWVDLFHFLWSPDTGSHCFPGTRPTKAINNPQVAKYDDSFHPSHQPSTGLTYYGANMYVIMWVTLGSQ